MKKYISLLLSIAMLFLSTMSISAIDKTSEKTPYIENNEYWASYSYLDTEKRVGIMAYKNDEIIVAAFHYKESPELIYQWVITDHEGFNFNSPSIQDWEHIVSFAEENIDSSDVFEMKQTRITGNGLSDNSFDYGETRNSAGSELRSQLSAIYGSPYTGTLLGTYLRGGKTVRIYEDMSFTITEMGTTGWGSAITLAALITGYLDEAITNTLVHALSIILGVADTMYAVVDPNTILRISCNVDYYRYSTYNGSAYAYTQTIKFIEYDAYDDTDYNSSVVAQLDTSSVVTSYSDSASYFNSLASQADDAYAMYLQIGQMP